MKVDYIIVGVGLAGLSFCEQLKQNNKSFIVFDNASQKSSTVAAGLYNPVVLKRFTSVWKSKLQLEEALPMYKRLEKRLNIKLDYKLPVYRKFASVEEQNNWFAASDQPNLTHYLSTAMVNNTNQYIDAPFGFGEVKNTGRIDTKCLIEQYKKHLIKDALLKQEAFNYTNLEMDNGCFVSYKDVKAKYIVFSEGFGVIKNSFFKHLPLVPAKGELIKIYAPELKMDFILKSNVFIVPLGKDFYLVGSTYNWDDLTHNISIKARNELLKKLKACITCDFELIEQFAGIRPTVKDRRPLVGVHNSFKNVYVLNGLGTRGVMIGPYIAKQLFDFIERKVPLDREININRFDL